MTAIIDVVFTLFFTIWLIASVYFQYNKSKLLKYNFFGFMPYCRFFAPDPVGHDTTLYIRGIDRNGKVSNWVSLFDYEKSSICFLWNPSIRVEKSITTIARELKPYMEDEKHVYLSFPYLKFLNVSVSRYKENLQMTHVQFMITKHAGFEDSTREYVFISNTHKLRWNVQ